jgi:hypothetical protein
MPDNWTDEEFDAAVEAVTRFRRAELRKTLWTVCVCAVVVALAGLAAGLVGAFW